MAKIVQAVNQYGPKLERAKTVQFDTIVRYMAQHTGLSRSEVMMVLLELHDTILYFNRGGQAVKLPEIGTFSPGMDRNGNLRTNFRADVRLKTQMNDQHEYNGRIIHKSRIGWSDEEYKELWDAEHPDDPLEI